MARPVARKSPFTRAARQRWEQIPEWAQLKILDNVFCSICLSSVTIVLETADMDGDYLKLRGQCKNCGKKVCRVVEPECD